MNEGPYLDGYSYIFHLFGIWKSGATYKTAFLNRKYNTFVKSKKKKRKEKTYHRPNTQVPE